MAGPRAARSSRDTPRPWARLMSPEMRDRSEYSVMVSIEQAVIESKMRSCRAPKRGRSTEGASGLADSAAHSLDIADIRFGPDDVRSAVFPDLEHMSRCCDASGSGQASGSHLSSGNLVLVASTLLLVGGHAELLALMKRRPHRPQELG